MASRFCSHCFLRRCHKEIYYRIRMIVPIFQNDVYFCRMLLFQSRSGWCPAFSMSHVSQNINWDRLLLKSDNPKSVFIPLFKARDPPYILELGIVYWANFWWKKLTCQKNTGNAIFIRVIQKIQTFCTSILVMNKINRCKL